MFELINVQGNRLTHGCGNIERKGNLYEGRLFNLETLILVEIKSGTNASKLEFRLRMVLSATHENYEVLVSA